MVLGLHVFVKGPVCQLDRMSTNMPRAGKYHAECDSRHAAHCVWRPNRAAYHAIVHGIHDVRNAPMMLAPAGLAGKRSALQTRLVQGEPSAKHCEATTRKLAFQSVSRRCVNVCRRLLIE